MKYLTMLLVIFSLTLANAYAQDVRSQLQQLANDLSKQIEAKGRKRVVIAAFLDLDNKETQLGRYMADKFGIGFMKANTSLQLTDRSQLAQVLRDNKLGSDRILDPRTIPILGRLTGAEVIIIGNYTVLDNSLDVTVKAIDLERGLTLAVTEGTVPRTSEVNKLLTEVDNQKTNDINNVTDLTSKASCKGKNSSGVTITVKECILSSRMMECHLIVTNNRVDKADASVNYNSRETYIITDTGRQYGADRIDIANSGNWSMYGNVTYYPAIHDVTVFGVIKIPVEDSSVKKLQIFEMKDQGLRCTNVPVVSAGSR